jgi:hypothetical protein
MAKIKLGKNEFSKSSGYDKKHKENYKELTKDINEKYRVVIKTFNKYIYINDKEMRVFVDLYRIDTNENILSLILTKEQSPASIDNIIEQLERDYK